MSSSHIRGYDGEPVYYDIRKGGKRQLAVSFPGMGYTHNHPYMFYLNHLLAQKEFDVARVHYHYKDSKTFMDADIEKKAEWVSYDACQVFDAITENTDYRKIALLGKSIGTMALGGLIEKKNVPEAEIVWLTPLLHNQKLFEKMKNCTNRSMVIGGTTDPSFDVQKAIQLKEKNRFELEIIENADHGMAIEGDVLKSIDVLQQTMIKVSEFLDGGLDG